MHRVVAIVRPVQSMLELGFAAEVFGMPRPGIPQHYAFELCTEVPGPVATSAGYPITVSRDLAALATADTVIVPGWTPVEAPIPDAVRAALLAAHERGARLASICSGVTLSAAGSTAAPWKAALFSLPSLTYSISPSLLFALLLIGGLGLLLAAGVLVHLARRRPEVEAAPAPAPAPPAPVLPPVERALLLLELSERVDGAGDQRRALERVADELTRRGETELARAARALAWSERPPGTEQTIEFAASARPKVTETTDATAA